MTVALMLFLAGCATGDSEPKSIGERLGEMVPETGPAVAFPLRHNLDGELKTVDEGWMEGLFPGRSTVRVEDGVAYLDKGQDMTGITWRGPLVRMNYEITLEAMRVEGSDFFCGLTFPYGDSVCSFIVGGWGGTCVGISSVDYYDAYNNETAEFRKFELGEWYKIRVRVTPDKIECWIDDDQLVDLTTTDRIISIRWEMSDIVPFGIATWQTTGAIRNVELKKLDDE